MRIGARLLAHWIPNSFDEAFEDSYSPGGLEFKVVSVDGHEVEWGVSGTSEHC